MAKSEPTVTKSMSITNSALFRKQNPVKRPRARTQSWFAQKRYYDLILNAQTCLLVTAQSKDDSVQSVVKQVSDDEQNKCNVVHCRSPWSIARDQPAAVIHVANVSQTGFTMQQLVVSAGDQLDAVGAEMKASACPEDADEVLAAEAVNLEISS